MSSYTLHFYDNVITINLINLIYNILFINDNMYFYMDSLPPPNS